MLISKMIEELEEIRKYHGDIRVCLQSTPSPGDKNGPIITYESFFIFDELHGGPYDGYKYLRDEVHMTPEGAVESAEQNDPEEMVVNIRTWHH